MGDTRVSMPTTPSAFATIVAADDHPSLLGLGLRSRRPGRRGGRCDRHRRPAAGVPAHDLPARLARGRRRTQRLPLRLQRADRVRRCASLHERQRVRSGAGEPLHRDGERRELRVPRHPRGVRRRGLPHRSDVLDAPSLRARPIGAGDAAARAPRSELARACARAYREHAARRRRLLGAHRPRNDGSGRTHARDASLLRAPPAGGPRSERASDA